MMSIAGIGESCNSRVGELGWVSTCWVPQPEFMCEEVVIF